MIAVVGAIALASSTVLAGAAVPPTITKTANDVRTLLGGLDATIVFVHDNDGTFGSPFENTVWKIDTQSWTPTEVKEGAVQTTLGAESPLISPDGTRIVFSTSYGAMKIVDLTTGAATLLKSAGAFSPHWYVDGSTEYIIYTDLTTSSTNSALGATYRIPSAGGTATALWPTRAMDAGITPDGRFLGESYDYNLTVDFDSGVGVEDAWAWFQVGATDIDDYRTCNGSMSPETDPHWRMMSLLLPHQYFGIFRYDDDKGRFALEHRHACPAMYVEWNHVEWSTHPEFGIATVGNNIVEHYPIIFNIETANTAAGRLEIASTHALWPHMYVYSASQQYLTLQPGHLEFSALDGETDTQQVTVSISNTGGGAFGAIAIDNVGGEPAWLSTGTITGTGDDRTFTVTIDPNGQAVGTVTHTIQVSAAGANNSPRDLVVTLETLSDAAGADADGDGQDNATEDANGTDPLDKYDIYVAPSSGGGGGCASDGSASPLALIALAAGLAVFAVARRQRGLVMSCAAAMLLAASLTSCDDGGDDGPSYPIALQSARNSSTSVTIWWVDAITDDSMNIYRGVDGGAYTLLTNVAATDTYEDLTAAIDQEYKYYVEAVVGGNPAGESNRHTADWVKVTSPNGTEVWKIGTLYPITWVGHLNSGTDWRILVRVGGSAPELVYESYAVSGWQWKAGYIVGAAANSTPYITTQTTDVRIEVKEYGSAFIIDGSDADLTVEP